MAHINCRDGDCGEDPKAMGLMTGHAYSIIKVVLSTCGKQLVQVRNPWGNFEWNGAYSDKADILKSHLVAVCCSVLQCVAVCCSAARIQTRQTLS